MTDSEILSLIFCFSSPFFPLSPNGYHYSPYVYSWKTPAFRLNTNHHQNWCQGWSSSANDNSSNEDADDDETMEEEVVVTTRMVTSGTVLVTAIM